MTARASAWAALTVVAGLVLVLTYALRESRIPAPAPRARMQEALQAMQLHDAELNREVLMARAGWLPDYDALTGIGQSLFRDVTTLGSESMALTHGAAGPIRQEVEVLAQVVQQKLALVEYLKSDSALLRNSVAYFLRTSRLFGARGTTGPYAREVAALSHRILQFMQAPETDATQETQAALDRLAALPHPPAKLKALLVHGRLIMELLPGLDGLTQAILTTPTIRHAETLQGALLAYADRVEGRAQYFRVLLYLAAVTLLIYLLHQLARLRANAGELRRKEVQLIQANKMTSLGILVSGIAHEINNPNQVIAMDSSTIAGAWHDARELLDERWREEGEFYLGGLPYTEMRETLPQLIQEIHDSARRIERIIGDLKDFARPGRSSSAQTAVQLNQVVQQALRLLAHLIHKRTDQLRVELSEGLPPLHGDAQQVEQIVINLVINALEALPHRHCAVAVTTFYDAARRSAVLEVQDQGVGIRPEHLPRLGEPFFTTKQTSGGSGLGLAITSSLVRLHQGRLAFTSEPGRGTRARVEFPSLRPELPLTPMAV
ncbi:DAHL domain-containing protein [Candidatus Methylocalor cossyra]|uniref:histidine kinase n=1 Tax=Candidatus Methylocalor cossyra TaxID=3108543 RepID=A0ABP1C9G8_9GAMM